MKAGRILREAGTAVWIGGQLFGIFALPAAGQVMMRRRDRHKAMVAGWRAWAPVSFAALAATLTGTLLERGQRHYAREHRHSRTLLTSALLAVGSTIASTVLGEVLAHDLGTSGAITRNAAGVPIAHLAHRRFLQFGMIPINVVHGIAAAGLVLAGE